MRPPGPACRCGRREDGDIAPRRSRRIARSPGSRDAGVSHEPDAEAASVPIARILHSDPPRVPLAARADGAHVPAEVDEPRHGSFRDEDLRDAIAAYSFPTPPRSISIPARLRRMVPFAQRYLAVVDEGAGAPRSRRRGRGDSRKFQTRRRTRSWDRTPPTVAPPDRGPSARGQWSPDRTATGVRPASR